MKLSVVCLCVLFTFSLSGQNYEKKMKNISSEEQAKAFIKDNPDLSAEILEFNSGSDSSALFKKLTAEKANKIVSAEGFSYKIVEAKKSSMLRVSYIYLDGSKLSMFSIDSLRKEIISQYNNGITFPELAKKYTMDGNPGTDLGWIAEEMFVKEFSAAVKAHKKGDIFTVDVPDKKWYQVTLKNADDKEVMKYTVLKVKSGK